MPKFPYHLVVATWNHSSLTRRFLEAYRDQSTNHWPLWIIDNASTDDTQEVLAEFQSQLPSIRVLKNPENVGCARAWNRGIRAALDDGASLIGILNNDVVPAPNWDIGLIRFWQEARPPVRVFSPSVDTGPLANFNERAIAFCQRNALRTRRKMRSEALFIESNVFREVGFFDERFFVSFEDADFYLRLREHGIHPVTTGASRFWHQEKSTRQALPSSHESDGLRIFRQKWNDPDILCTSGWEASRWHRRYWRLRDQLGLL